MDHNRSTGSTRPEPAKAEQPPPFPGFKMPDQNWSKLPNELIEALHMFETLGELMAVLYVLRHTWGFQEYGTTKRITHDEFQHGRKRRDGSRLDSGTGLSLNCLKDGIRRAVAHGFLLQEVEHWRDPGRRSYLYSLRMSNSDPRGSGSDTPEVRDRPPGDQGMIPRGARVDTRSSVLSTMLLWSFSARTGLPGTATSSRMEPGVAVDPGTSRPRSSTGTGRLRSVAG
jgi:hypothetical protein